MSFEFYDHQKKLIPRAASILELMGFVYLAMEVRTGKTLTALGVANKVGASKVLFVTKKKAISSITGDYDLYSPSFDLDVINYESLHKVDSEYDLIIVDEAHSLGAFPKPSKRAVQIKELIQKNEPWVILLSGTPTPESYSQMYHQVYGIPGNPFDQYKNFYRFSDDYVNVTQKKYHGRLMNDYSDGSKAIIDEMEAYTINYTQSEAGFVSTINEKILYVPMPDAIKDLVARLKKFRLIEGKNEEIVADTPVKLMQKTHQLCSGTIKFESGNRVVLDTFKADFIRDQFDGKKIGIFYKFVAELEAIKKAFGKDNVTQDIDEFNNTDCQVIALQIVSGREGISLRNAEDLVFFNIDFSATSYWQARDRMTTKDRLNNTVWWVFSEEGIEKDIYQSVLNKKDYTLSHFNEYAPFEPDGWVDCETYCSNCGLLLANEKGPKSTMTQPCPERICANDPLKS